MCAKKQAENLFAKITNIYTPIFNNLGANLSKLLDTPVQFTFEEINQISNLDKYLSPLKQTNVIVNVEEYSQRLNKFSLSLFSEKMAITLAESLDKTNSEKTALEETHLESLKKVYQEMLNTYNAAIPNIDLILKKTVYEKNTEESKDLLSKINYPMIVVKGKITINNQDDYFIRIVPEDILMFDKKMNDSDEVTVKGDLIDHEITKNEKYTNATFDEFPMGMEIPQPEEPAPEQPITVQPVQFPSFDNHLGMKLEGNRNFDLLLDIKLKLTVELGRTELPIKKILELTRGSIIELDKIAGEPVELYASGKMIAKGEVVVIEDNFGLRIISIVSPDDRIKNL